MLAGGSENWMVVLVLKLLCLAPCLIVAVAWLMARRGLSWLSWLVVARRGCLGSSGFELVAATAQVMACPPWNYLRPYRCNDTGGLVFHGLPVKNIF